MSLHDPPPPRPVVGEDDVDKHSQYASLAARASLGIRHDTMEGRAERRGRRRPRAVAGGAKPQAGGRTMFSVDDASVDVGFLKADTLSRLLPSKTRVFKDHGPRLSKKMVRDALHSDLPVGIQHGSQSLSYTGSPVKPARLSSHGPILEALTYDLAREKTEAHAALLRVSELDRKLKAARILDEQLKAAPEDLELGLTGLVGNDITHGGADGNDEETAAEEEALAASSAAPVQLSDGSVGICPPVALRTTDLVKKRRHRHVDLAEVERAGAALGIGRDLSLKLEDAIEKAVSEFHWGGLSQDLTQGDLDSFGPAALSVLLRAAHGQLPRKQSRDLLAEVSDEDDGDSICAALMARPMDLTAQEIELIRAGARRRRVMQAIAAGEGHTAAHLSLTNGEASPASPSGDSIPHVLTTRLTKEALGRALGAALRMQQAARLLGPAAAGAFASHFAAHWAHGENPMKDFDLTSLATKSSVQRPHSHESARGLPPVDEPSVAVSRRHMENLIPSPSRRSGRSGSVRRRSPTRGSSSSDEAARGSSSVRDLRGAYRDSQARLEGIRGQLRDEVERLTLAMPPGAMSGGGAVGSFAQQWACDRMKSVMRKLVHQQLALAFETIVLFAAYRLNLEVIESFRLVRGARRMGRPFLSLLDKHFRASFYIWQRHTAATAGAESQAAAVEICRVGRGFMVRRRIYHGERHLAALNIQRCQRGHLGRIKMHKWRRYTLEKNAVLLIERNWELMLMIRNARKMVRAKRRELAAIQIQGMVRVAIALKSMRRLIGEKFIADTARRIQVFCRGAMTRYRVGMLRGAHKTVRSVETIQKIGRGYVTRKKTHGKLARHRAAKVLQRLWRARVQRKLAGMKEEQTAASSVQAIYRGRLGRTKAKKRAAWKNTKDNDQAKSAQVIQGKIRQREARKVVAAKKAEKKKVEDKGATALQNVYRGKVARAKVAEKKVEKKRDVVKQQKAKSSTLIQSQHRVKLAKKKVARKKKELWAFTFVALRLQSRFRARAAKQRVTRLKQKQQGAIGDIKSSYWKMHALYMLRQAEMHDKEARIIQNMIRVQMSKIRLRYMRAALAEAAERKRRDEAARVIQGMLRKVAARATIALLREEMKETKRMEALALKVRQEQAALTIQGAYRGGAAKAQMAHMKYLRDRLKASKLLIRMIRGRLGRKKYAMLRMLREQELQVKREKDIAVMRIQALQRGIAARSALRDRILDDAKAAERQAKMVQYNATVTIQCCVRKKLSRRRFRERKVIKRKEDEEKKIQEELENELAELHRKQEQMLLVIRIQCCARKRLARAKVKRTREAREAEAEERAMQVRHKAASAIQSYVKGQNTRKWFLENKLKIRQKQQQHRRLMYV
jgi:hypothetical protein